MTGSRLALVIGTLLAIVAGVVVYLAVRTAQTQVAGPSEVMPVVVAAADLPAGTTFVPASMAGLVRVERRPAASVPAEALPALAFVEGRTTSQAVAAGEPVLASALVASSPSGPGAAPSGGATGVASLVPAGQVATVLPASEQVSLGFGLRPGDRADIVASLPVRQADGSQRVVTQTLLRNVPVLATGTFTLADPPGQRPGSYPTVTVALPPQDALVVQHLLASSVRIALVLRRPDDAPAETRPITMDEVARRFGLVEQP